MRHDSFNIYSSRRIKSPHKSRDFFGAFSLLTADVLKLFERSIRSCLKLPRRIMSQFATVKAKAFCVDARKPRHSESRRTWRAVASQVSVRLETATAMARPSERGARAADDRHGSWTRGLLDARASHGSHGKPVIRCRPIANMTNG